MLFYNNITNSFINACYKIYKNIALDYGTKRQTNERISLKNLSQALTGIREVKILNKENKFIRVVDTSTLQ